MFDKYGGLMEDKNEGNNEKNGSVNTQKSKEFGTSNDTKNSNKKGVSIHDEQLNEQDTTTHKSTNNYNINTHKNTHNNNKKTQKTTHSNITNSHKNIHNNNSTNHSTKETTNQHKHSKNIQFTLPFNNNIQSQANIYFDQNINKNTNNDDKSHSKLFGLLHKNKVEIPHFVYVWSNCLKQSEELRLQAIQLLLNLICEASGLGPNFYPCSVVKAVDEHVNNEGVHTPVSSSHDILNTYFEEHFNKQTTHYPFGNKTHYKGLKETLKTFFTEFSSSLFDISDVEFDTITSIYTNWLFPLSAFKYRKLRICSTSLGLCLMEGLLITFEKVNEGELKFRKQLNAEIKNMSKFDAENNKICQNLTDKIQTMRTLLSSIKQFFNKQYALMFANKIRDISHEIRLETLNSLKNWINIVPSWLLDRKYTKYLVWTLCDKESDVRLCSLAFLNNFLGLLAKQEIDETTKQWLTEFVNNSHGRVINMQFDENTDVKTEAINCLNKMATHNFINAQNIQTNVVNALMHTNNNKVSQAYAYFINNHLLKMPILREETTEEENVANQLLVNAPFKKRKHEYGEEKDKERCELMCLLGWLKDMYGVMNEGMCEYSRGMYMLVVCMVGGMWGVCPCIRNICLMCECLCVGEGGEGPIEGLEEGVRTPLLYICECSLKTLINNIEICKQTNTKEAQQTHKQHTSHLQTSILYILQHANHLLTLHKSDPLHLFITTNILTITLQHTHILTHTPTFYHITQHLLNIIKHQHTPFLYKSAIHCLTSLPTHTDTNLTQILTDLNVYFTEQAHTLWHDIQNNSIKAINEGEYGVEFTSSKEHHLSLTIQKLVYIHSSSQVSLSIEASLLELCSQTIKQRILSYHTQHDTAHTVDTNKQHDTHTNEDINIEEDTQKQHLDNTHNNKHQKPQHAIKLVLNSCDLLLVYYEKLVYSYVRGCEEYSKIINSTETHKEASNNNSNINTHETILSGQNNDTNTYNLQALQDNLQHTQKTLLEVHQSIINLLFGLLEVEDDDSCSFGVFLVVMTMGQLSPLWSTTETFEQADLEVLFNTLNNFLNEVENSTNTDLNGQNNTNTNTHTQSDEQLNSDINNIFQMLPFHSCSPLLQAIKDAPFDSQNAPYKLTPENKLHIAITCCQFVIRSHNMQFWMSNIGTLILIQLNMKQKLIASEAIKFFNILKKQDIDQFFQLLLKSLELLHSAVLTEDLSNTVVTAFTHTVSLKLGISLPTNTKIALCKFLYDAIQYSSTNSQNEALLDYLNPILSRHFLSKQEMQFFETQLRKGFISEGNTHNKKIVDRVIRTMTKKTTKAKATEDEEEEEAVYENDELLSQNVVSLKNAPLTQKRDQDKRPPEGMIIPVLNSSPHPSIMSSALSQTPQSMMNWLSQRNPPPMHVVTPSDLLSRSQTIPRLFTTQDSYETNLLQPTQQQLSLTQAPFTTPIRPFNTYTQHTKTNESNTQIDHLMTDSMPNSLLLDPIPQGHVEVHTPQQNTPSHSLLDSHPLLMQHAPNYSYSSKKPHPLDNLFTITSTEENTQNQPNKSTGNNLQFTQNSITSNPNDLTFMNNKQTPRSSSNLKQTTSKNIETPTSPPPTKIPTPLDKHISETKTTEMSTKIDKTRSNINKNKDEDELSEAFSWGISDDDLLSLRSSNISIAMDSPNMSPLSSPSLSPSPMKMLQRESQARDNKENQKEDDFKLPSISSATTPFSEASPI